MQVYMNCWKLSIQEMKTKPINANHKETNSEPKTLGWDIKAKLIFAKPKAKTDSTSYLIDIVGMVDFGTVVPISLKTAHVKGP